MTPQQEASRRRRIVYHAARNRLPDEMVSAAVKLCDREFQALPVFSVQKFISRLTEAVGPPPKPGELFTAMNRLRVVADLDAIGPDPVGGAAPATTAPPAPEPAPRFRPAAPASGSGRIDSWAAAFTALMNGVLGELRHLGPDLPDAARAGVALRVQKADLGPQGYAELNAWADGQVAAFTDRLSTKDMHAGLHELYLWVCEELGPVECDRVFGAVLREVSALPGAAQFPPRSLM
ncbi:Uncharacterized protein OS=Candidatus Entotheonella sp. TSY1 GN=ETSY1_39595 PE=4 SV=1 [Gemmataceae bacterium]|nr:Uncharacterized protein OS=Candidatus Entotheonella sp. TSY1 GN=ETSY1_39595 PE=4 SV=1 [Gemmataceae bacterium]VTT97773.1 Uncharacterized protein OS=Candidatus Entotheonella sp. TSY1 GN=ETSY1_39595 PE=4 SV=1 [Gemmataceae bacterium]